MSILFFAGACVAVLPKLSQDQIRWANVRWPDVTPEELNQGRRLYVSRCSGCHTLFLPQDFTAVQWQHQLEEMGEQAKLNASQREMVFKYLISAAEMQKK